MRSGLEYSLHGIVGHRIAFAGGAKDWEILEPDKLSRGLGVEWAGQQRQSDDVRVAGGRLDAQENTAACAADADDLGPMGSPQKCCSSCLITAETDIQGETTVSSPNSHL